MKKKSVTIGLFVLCLLILLAIAVPVCSPYSYEEQNIARQNEGASLQHPFGTDKFGRDILVRVFYGAGISLFIGSISAAICMAIAVCYGGAAGYLGGKADLVLMRIADILYSIPSLLYIILLMLVFGAHVMSIVAGICIAGWIETARILRTEIFRLKEQEFSVAARLSGASDRWVLFRHLLPNAMGPVVVSMTFLIPQVMFTEAFLSFLGIGISVPAASLGTLLQEARSQMFLYPMQMLYPVMILCMIIVALNLIGSGLLETSFAGKKRREQS